jgi:S-adenosylmethionine hydrolase
MSSQPIITLLTDFGQKDHYVGAMKGVILGICPNARTVDISHGIAPYAIPEAAYTLSQAWACFPPNTIHVVVVDPGVGSIRRPILATAGEHLFVAPDNGVLTMVFDDVATHDVREITASGYFRRPVSKTFHGRDIFAPVAAHLAAGVEVEKFGIRIRDFQRLSFGKPVQTGPNNWSGRILNIDRFGNAVTNFASSAWPELVTGAFEIRVRGTSVTHFSRTYADAMIGQPFVIPGSSGYLELSLKEASAADAIKIRPGESVDLSWTAL